MYIKNNLLQNYSLKKHFAAIFFLVAVIPVSIASILFYSFLSYEQKIRIESQKNYEQQAKYSVLSYLNNLDYATQLIAKSNELIDYISSPERLRTYTENRLFARISEVNNQSTLKLSILILSTNGEVLYNDKITSLKNEEVQKIINSRQDSLQLSEDNMSIINIKLLKYDDQQLEGPTAVTKGYLITIMPISSLQDKISDFIGISVLDKDVNKIKLILNKKLSSHIPIATIFIVLLVLMLLALAAGLILVQKQIIIPLTKMTDNILNHTVGPKISKFDNEISTLNAALGSYVDQIKKDRNLIVEKTQSAALGELAAQVSHDIRSPLSALNMIAANLNEVAEGKRILIRNATQRINDIANNLLTQSRLAKAKALSFEAIEQPQSFSPQLASVLIETIVSEKRAQLQNEGIDFNIEQNVSDDSFIKMDSVVFKRIISNLINNSIEAISHSTGEIKISAKAFDNHIEIQIQDNGCGISEDKIKKIGQKGYTYGKENTNSGNGLGVHYAKFELKKIGGDFNINSKLGIGTIITLKIPKADPPSWFTSEIHIKNIRTIVVLDDDDSIHDIWKQRFININGGAKLLHFKTSSQIQNYLNSETFLNDKSGHIFLTDYELLGEEKTGLDIIEKNDISYLSILVTSRYEDQLILNRCLNIKLKVIPKSIAPFITIKS